MVVSILYRLCLLAAASTPYHLLFVVTPYPLLYVHTDLMQGQNPTDAFASLPPSMRGADETLDDAVLLEPLVQAAPRKKGPREQLWSLDKEQVCI